MQRRDIWWGVAQACPDFAILRAARARWPGALRARDQRSAVVDGDIADLAQPFDHYPFSKVSITGSASIMLFGMEAELIAKGTLIKPSWRVALLGSDLMSGVCIKRRFSTDCLPAR